ncbi:unnamed protein product [Paramecium sonneborni]|uniref:Uncharacterized protein n=1 Tax=Paramecium sonneborni TaxID=65129 RepID=A0A8S1KPI3_9CILI|nr:unnamed protein product [Paramecium sonneborni]
MTYSVELATCSFPYNSQLINSSQILYEYGLILILLQKDAVRTSFHFFGYLGCIIRILIQVQYHIYY